ncbi:MAG: hypothetical protein KC620_04730 [Myxococcales bacterium]|nr:hypothetical protein [Myxococcales bacterium]
MRVSASLGLLAALLASPAAAQQPACADLPGLVLAPGTTDVKPYLARIAPHLATADPPLTLAYVPLGSCTALDYVLQDVDVASTAVYWPGEYDDDGKPIEAACDIAPGARAQLALSDVTVETCTGGAPPADVGQFPSLIQGFGFVVPPDSSQVAITATEAYFIFKFGGEPGREVPPWTDPAAIHIRTPASSTQLLIGLAAGIRGTMWSPNLVTTHNGSGDLLAAVAAENATGNADQTLGILSLQRYDGARDQVRMLAFEAFDQSCLGAVYPDSTPASFDKRNVRDGHYPIWGSLWTMTAVDGSGQPTDAGAARLIDFIAGTTPQNGADPIADAALAGAVPPCAMSVRRAYDGAPLERFDPAEPCGCVFEQVVTGGTACVACDEGQPCDEGVCRFGFCEAR